jgi:hypothetical protein
MEAAPVGALCSKHPQSSAQFICDNCGSFACSACVPIGVGGTYWHKCTADRIDPTWKPISTKTASVGIAFAVFSCVPFAGFALAPIALLVVLAGFRYEPDMRRSSWIGLALVGVGALVQAAIVLYIGTVG